MKKKAVFITSLTVLVTAVSALAVVLLYPLFNKPAGSEIKTPIDLPNEVLLPDNPIDFKALQERNSDVCGYIKVPGTNVDYPVLQVTDLKESYYLNHNIDKKYEFAGSIYSQKYNSRDFTDPHTVLYGHNMLNGSMFATLHRFKNKDFFEQNRYIYIYTPGHILTYEIFAAYRFDNRHLLYWFDCTTQSGFKTYLDTIYNHKDTIKNIKKDVKVTEKDRIITLSTCITNDNYRYLVQGVLIDDQKTN